VSDWRRLVKGVIPVETGNGRLYELRPNPLDRPFESLAIADMRGLRVSEPHYHTAGTELYFVLAGMGTVVIRDRPEDVTVGSVVITPPETAHFTVPHGLVLAVMNTPPFELEHYVPLTKSHPRVGFDRAQYDRYCV